jgi:hypothetical protein
MSTVTWATISSSSNVVTENKGLEKIAAANAHVADKALKREFVLWANHYKSDLERLYSFLVDDYKGNLPDYAQFCGLVFSLTDSVYTHKGQVKPLV